MSNSRLHPDNCLWVLCCCGCLPILGFLKGIITMIPSALIELVPCTIIAIILLPHDIFYTYYTILATTKIGRNVKGLAMLLLPIPLILWPISVSIISILFGAGYGLFLPITRTFDIKYNVFYGGIVDTIVESAKFVKEFWHFNYNSYFSYLYDFRIYKLRPNEKPFEISFLQMIVGVLIGTSGSIIDGIGFTLISLIKVIPAIVRGYYELWKWFGNYLKKCGKSCLDFVWFGLIFPSFILGNIVLPIGIALIAIFFSISGFFIGVSAGYVAYDEGITIAYEKVFKWIADYNKETNKFIFDH